MSDRALDPDALRYQRHWEPVLTASAQRTLDRLGAVPSDLLDLGAGTGSLTVAALQRWPATRVWALDPSGAMLAVARSRVAAGDAERVTWLSADAADLPLDDASIDAVVCSFVLQLVDDRAIVLGEVSRVLRPGGAFAFVTWLASDLDLPADATYHDVLGDLDDDDDDESFRSPRSGDFETLEQARTELAAAGFEVARVVRDELRFRWTAESYLAFKLEYDDHERVASLDATRREQLRASLVARLAALPPDAFEVRGPLVAAVAHRPRSAGPP